jgi:glycosyltransferase involved in cell wall biosynthesis
MRTSNRVLNRGIWSLRCSRGNCPPAIAKPCWLNGQYGKGRTPGVDVVGYHLSEIGLGETARLMVRALDTAGISTGLVNVPLANRMNENSMKERISEPHNHSIALSVFGALEITSFARRTCRGQLNIAYPFWELPTFPVNLKQAFDGFDAYWAPSNFIREMLMENQKKPVYLIPHPVQLPNFPVPEQTFSGPLKIYTFFDFDSFLARKNPIGAIQAFLAAFPLGTEDVKFLIKARGTPLDYDSKILYAMAQSDPRISIQEGLLSRLEMSELMAECNVFISLHRSEGFGLGCAEALALKKIVVATDFGGTKDFISTISGFPVSYQQTHISPKEYPMSKGSYWAEPNIEHAASILKEIYANPQSASTRSRFGIAHLQLNNSFAAVGAIIKSVTTIENFQNKVRK